MLLSCKALNFEETMELFSRVEVVEVPETHSRVASPKNKQQRAKRA